MPITGNVTAGGRFCRWTTSPRFQDDADNFRGRELEPKRGKQSIGDQRFLLLLLDCSPLMFPVCPWVCCIIVEQATTQRWIVWIFELRASGGATRAVGRSFGRTEASDVGAFGARSGWSRSKDCGPGTESGRLFVGRHGAIEATCSSWSMLPCLAMLIGMVSGRSCCCYWL